jgi:hypothetical protein
MASYEARLSLHEMLAELSRLDASMELKLEREDVPAEVRRRANELHARVEECRQLVASRATRAQNILSDTLVAYRELAFTAFATITTPAF